jgi:hypothetical protein
MSIFNGQISPRRLAKWQHKERMAMYNNPNFNQFPKGTNFPYFPQNREELSFETYPYFPQKGIGDKRLGTNFPYFPQKLDPKILSYIENNPYKFKIDMSQAKEVKGSVLDLLREYNENRQIQGGAFTPTYSVGGGVGPVNWNKLNDAILDQSISSVTSRPTSMPTSKANQSFNQAFAAARAAGEDTFSYNGKMFNTRYKGEKVSQGRNNNAEMADIATSRMNQFNQGNKTYQGPPIKIKAKRIDNNFIPSYNRNMGNQLSQTRGDQTNLNDFQRIENAYNSGKTFLDLRGKEKQLAPLAAADAMLTYAAKNIGLPIAKTVSGVGSTSDKIQSGISAIPFASGVTSAMKPVARQLAKQVMKRSTAYMAPRMLIPIAKNPNATKARLASWFTQANPQLAEAIKKYGVDYLTNGL